ncbi:hypothetical protein ACQP2Y_00170 [Actinoplanes sp. CA-051413]|uniref:hypothetical protein n=1 Tax=Actinoplanes sp. CA-051413 TaxID=3239899 RepID=UPI003D96BB0C
MTGRVVERDARTAYRSASVRPAGVSALMPPHSQGAERRKEHRAGRTGSRWGLRALVVGGLAGAAWLLTGAAAHAADRDPAGEGLSLGSSLIGSVVHGESHSVPVVDRVLKAAVKPLASDHHRRLAAAVALPGKLVGTPAPATKSSNDADPVLGGVDSVVRELTAPLRPSGEAVDTRKLVPVTDVREPEPPRAGSAPALPVRHSATRVSGSEVSGTDVSEVDAEQSDEDLTAAGEIVADQVSTVGEVVDRDEEVPAAERQPDRRDQVGKTVARQHTFAADRHRAAATAAELETVSDTPGGDGPAPLRVHLGAANGVPASGPSTATEGGSAAFLPAKVADSTVACHRLPIAADVEVRRHDAEAPTVSPD